MPLTEDLITLNPPLMDDGENHPLAERSGHGAQLAGNGEPGRRIRNIRVSYDILCELLKLPVGTRIVASADERFIDQLLVRVESPDFPPIPDGGLIPFVVPRYRYDETLVGGHTRIRTVTFVGWE